MNFFNTIASRLVGGLDTTTITYINKLQVPASLDTSGSNFIDYNDISYGSTAFGLNTLDTNSTFISLKHSDGGLIQTSDLIEHPFKGFSIYMKYKIRDIPGNVNFSVNNSTKYRLFTTNLWPTFDDWENYSSVNPNKPDPRVPPMNIQIPIQPQFPSTINEYYSFSEELGNGVLTSFTNLEDVPAQGKVIGFVGRFTTPNTHWSEVNKPKEILILDPLPAACGGKLLNTHTITESNAVNDAMTSTSASDSWNSNWVIPNYGNNSFIVQPNYGGTSTDSRKDPGYYFRYFLGSVQGVLEQLEMDEYGGHTQPDGDWHVHTNTLFVSGYENCVIGYAVDGVPIMGQGSIVFSDTDISLGIATSNWRRRTTSEYTDTYVINGQTLPASQNGNGYYIYDYKFDNTIGGNLDHFNGGYTTIDGSLIYAYFVTPTYPLWPRNIRGKVFNLIQKTSVFSQLASTTPVIQLYTSHSEVSVGDTLQITVFQIGYTDLSYSITGVTSENLNGESLTGTITDMYTVLSYDIQSINTPGPIVFSAGDVSINVNIDITVQHLKVWMKMTDPSDIVGDTIKNHATDSYLIDIVTDGDGGKDVKIETKNGKMCCAIADGLIHIPDVVLSNDSNLTVTFWMRTNELTRQNTFILYDRHTTKGYPGLILKNQSNSNEHYHTPFSFKIGMYTSTSTSSTSYQSQSSNFNSNTGDWTHYAFVFTHEVGETKYVNGIYENSKANEYNGPSNYDSFFNMETDSNGIQTMKPGIGGAGNNKPVRIDLYDFRIYTLNLSSSDITKIYNETI